MKQTVLPRPTSLSPSPKGTRFPTSPIADDAWLTTDVSQHGKLQDVLADVAAERLDWQRWISTFSDLALARVVETDAHRVDALDKPGKQRADLR